MFETSVRYSSKDEEAAEYEPGIRREVWAGDLVLAVSAGWFCNHETGQDALPWGAGQGWKDQPREASVVGGGEQGPACKRADHTITTKLKA